jgi:hypothetical protein
MSGGSAKRGRKKAAGAALQYEHGPGRVVAEKPRQGGFSWAVASLVLSLRWRSSCRWAWPSRLGRGGVG